MWQGSFSAHHILQPFRFIGPAQNNSSNLRVNLSLLVSNIEVGILKSGVVNTPLLFLGFAVLCYVQLVLTFQFLCKWLSRISDPLIRTVGSSAFCAFYTARQMFSNILCVICLFIYLFSYFFAVCWNFKYHSNKFLFNYACFDFFFFLCVCFYIFFNYFIS